MAAFEDKLNIKADNEVKEIMTRPSTPRLQDLHRGSSTRRTPQEEKEEVTELNKRQKKDISLMRVQSAARYAKGAKDLQEEIDLLESQESLKKEDKDKIKLLKKKIKKKKAAVNYSLRRDSPPPLRRHSIGGKTRKKRKTKRKKSVFRKKRTKRKRRKTRKRRRRK